MARDRECLVEQLDGLDEVGGDGIELGDVVDRVVDQRLGASWYLVGRVGAATLARFRSGRDGDSPFGRNRRRAEGKLGERTLP
jgi:hypothetical protein